MLIIDERTETKLLQALESYKGQVEAPRCLHLRLAGRQLIPHDHLVEKIATRLENREAQIYFCEDGDVFVLAPRILPSQARSLAGHLNEAVDLHELVHGWRVVMVEVEKKENRIRLRLETLQRQLDLQKAEKMREAIVNAPLEQSLIQTIAERRTKHTKPEIMVIEDDAFSRRLVHNALSSSGNIRVVAEGRHAIEIYAETAPHMLLLDIDLPDVSGHDLLRRILSIDPEAYVVMLSGNGDRSNVMQAIESGAKGFVGKPFSKDKLVQYLERCPSLHAHFVKP